MSANKEELISLIVPVYNVEKYLRRCVDSILAQTYKNIEIILVDDGSTDYSGILCDEYKIQDNRIQVIHKENGGQSSARNVGLDAAHGEYIAFVDSDDFVHKEFIAILREGIAKYKADIAICDYEKGKKNCFSDPLKNMTYEVFSSEQLLKNWHGEHTRLETSPCNKLYKKYLFEGNRHRFRVGVYYEDIILLHLLIADSKQVALTKRKLYYYYQRKSSTVHSMKKEKNIHDNLVAQNERLEFFKKNNYTDAYDRLLIGKQKHLLLMYFSTRLQKTKKNLKKMYLENNKKIMDLKILSLQEKILFGMFHHFFRLKK